MTNLVRKHDIDDSFGHFESQAVLRQYSPDLLLNEVGEHLIFFFSGNVLVLDSMYEI